MSRLALLLALTVAITAVVSPAVADEASAPRRRGPDLLARHQNAARLLGSVEVSGTLAGAEGDAVLLHGRFAAGALSAALSPDSVSAGWTTFVRLDGDEVEVEDRRLGWIVRRSLGEVTIPVSEEGDLFGLLAAEGRAIFLGEDESGQRWEYAVRGGAVYRVWLADRPLRLVRRDVIRTGAAPTTFLYREFTGAAGSPLVLPRRITAERDGEVLFDLSVDRIALRPVVPRLRPLDPERRALFRSGEAIFTDSRYTAVAGRIARLSAVMASGRDGRGRVRAGDRSRQLREALRDSPALLDELSRIEADHGSHPVIDLQRALVGLAADDILLAGVSIRRAQPLGRPVITAAARVGVLELDLAGDSGLLSWALAAVEPEEPGALTEAEQALHAVVVSGAVDAWLVRAETAAAEVVLDRAWSLDPSNRDLTALVVEHRLGVRDETGAVRAARALVATRPDDLGAFYFLGDLLEAVGRAGDAEGLYRAGVESWPREAGPWLRLGRIHVRSGRLVEAEDAFRALIDRFEGWDDAASRRADIANEIAWHLADANIALADARRMADYALSVTPDDPYYLDTLGVVLWRMGRRTAAIMTFERALALLDHPRIREHLARARR